jgi:hypothetical protein
MIWSVEETPMFDSLEDQMKANPMESSSKKERWMRYLIISAVSIVAVGGIFAAVEFVK